MNEENSELNRSNRLYWRITFILLIILVGSLALPGKIIEDIGVGRKPTPTVTISESLGNKNSKGVPPNELLIPSVKIKAPVVPIALDAQQALIPPSDVSILGWWDASAKPGSDLGQTLITGHAYHSGEAPMNRLSTVLINTKVYVKAGKTKIPYIVTRIEKIDKDQVAERQKELFAQDRGEGRLVLVSCYDWNGYEYETNIFVFAEPL